MPVLLIMKNHQEILKRVISKGGLLGICAEQYIEDEQQATLYIIELSEQCHTDNIQKAWGQKLVDDIIAFSKNHHLKSKIAENKDDP